MNALKLEREENEIKEVRKCENKQKRKEKETSLMFDPFELQTVQGLNTIFPSNNLCILIQEGGG
jgi:hypothetical protein